MSNGTTRTLLMCGRRSSLLRCSSQNGKWPHVSDGFLFSSPPLSLSLKTGGRILQGMCLSQPLMATQSQWRSLRRLPTAARNCRQGFSPRPYELTASSVHDHFPRPNELDDGLYHRRSPSFPPPMSSRDQRTRRRVVPSTPAVVPAPHVFPRPNELDDGLYHRRSPSFPSPHLFFQPNELDGGYITHTRHCFCPRFFLRPNKLDSEVYHPPSLSFPPPVSSRSQTNSTARCTTHPRCRFRPRLFSRPNELDREVYHPPSLSFPPSSLFTTKFS